ncbi:MAG: hypothetical protein KAJ18_10380 [Candidatus Omnitrophica bacterium]|nr:hypothetical protein [Candidatus Omnitrophota bacterium]
MATAKKKDQIFKIANRSGYAMISCNHLTEGFTISQAKARMEKALARTERKKAKKKTTKKKQSKVKK